MVAEGGQEDWLSATTRWEKGFITGRSLAKIVDARYRNNVRKAHEFVRLGWDLDR
jgi:hypothetical protein